MSISSGPPVKRTNALGKLPKHAFPTHLDLPHTDNKPVENDYHPLQSEILRQSLVPHLEQIHPDGKFFLGADSGIYFRFDEPPEGGCRAPDFYYVPNVARTLDGVLRLSYVLWMEKVPPLLVVEYVSGNGAEEHDKTPNTGKFWIYENAIRAPYYAIWDWRKDKLEVFENKGKGYKPMKANADGRYSIPPMKVELGSQQGFYLEIEETWLRVWDQDGKLLPTLEEHADSESDRADSEHRRANAEKRRALAEKHRADSLAAKLRELGVDPNQL